MYWYIPYAFLFVTHVANILFDLTYTDGIDITKHQAIRIVTNLNEMVAITVLIFHHGYLVLIIMRNK